MKNEHLFDKNKKSEKRRKKRALGASPFSLSIPFVTYFFCVNFITSVFVPTGSVTKNEPFSKGNSRLNCSLQSRDNTNVLRSLLYSYLPCSSPFFPIPIPKKRKKGKYGNAFARAPALHRRVCAWFLFRAAHTSFNPHCAVFSVSFLFFRIIGRKG